MKLLPPLKVLRLTLFTLLAGFAFGYADDAEPALRVLICGQNNRDWRATTPRLKSILENGGRFAVDAAEQPKQCDAATLDVRLKLLPRIAA
jgi:hypothetical protein